MKRLFADPNARKESSTATGFEVHVLCEEGFHRSIILERKRAERSSKSFLLLLLDIGRLLAESGEEVVPRILSALSTSIRETDITGWYRKDTLGIVFTEIQAEDRSEIVGTVVSRVSGALYTNLTFDQFNQISISHYLFPEDWDHDIDHRPSDPTLYPDLEKKEDGSKAYFIAKRAIDILGSAFGLVVLSPVFLVIALAVKLSSRGPVFFRQTRVGQFGTPFVFLKFRSMYTNNDPSAHRAYVEKLIAGDAEKHPAGEKREGGVYKLTNDPRVTRVGAFLRRTSLDEIPQLYNVFRGEMSLVGPRPAIPYEVAKYKPWHRRRVLEAKPGITGLWQVSGRCRIGFDEMVRLDVRYSTQHSLWLDLKILMLTPYAVIAGEGAY